ncbi:MAG: GNAT family N-acetyltransferase [archaeon]
MEIELILNESEVPADFIDFKISHYKEVFRKQWKGVFDSAPFLDKGEELVVLKDSDKTVAGCVIQKDVYNLKLKNFSVMPEYRGQGRAKQLMQELEEIAKSHHCELTSTGKKPLDISLMYLKSMTYPNSDDAEEAKKLPALQFAQFLKKFDFTPHIYNKLELSPEEFIAVDAYRQLYPGLADKLKVFKKEVVNCGVELKPESQKELIALQNRKTRWDTVMFGLNWKLGNYGKTGKISYRYDLCPICKDMGSSEVNSDNCKSCYIYNTCLEPFRAVGRFKEDFEVSNAYFGAMRQFMLAHQPESMNR